MHSSSVFISPILIFFKEVLGYNYLIVSVCNEQLNSLTSWIFYSTRMQCIVIEN